VLPCHAAATIPNLRFPKVEEAGLQDIWYLSDAFNAYRGDAWMPEPCRSCARKSVDHGGCRCQAMALLGDPSATDPVCRKTPARAVVDAMLAKEPLDPAARPDLIMRG
ncbi:SPASM domain-containing protein, partial [Thioclava sp. BHET1]